MAYTKKQTLKYVFSEKHKEYIRRCVSCEFNVAEGAVRAGKTVDNVYAFAHELKTAPDRIHLATGSTVGNAKLNIGDCNGLGLENIFRGNATGEVQKQRSFVHQRSVNQISAEDYYLCRSF